MSEGLFWAAHGVLGFVPAACIRETPDSLELRCMTDDVQVVEVPKAKAQPVHRNSLVGVANLLELGEYSMPALLHNIRVRYQKNEFYSSIGLPILISVNPYRTLPHLYSQETRLRYMTATGDPAAPECVADLRLFADHPHLFGTAQMTFSALLRNKQAQSIVISGESGAGKTEATKILLRYFSELDDPSPHKAAQTTIESFIIDSNPVLEAFGNAKTVRNDNSSRFGRFIQLYFDQNNPRRLKCGRISHYLLEKCRLVSPYERERNFHVFYCLCLGAQQHRIYSRKLEDWGIQYPALFHRVLGAGDVLSEDDDFPSSPNSNAGMWSSQWVLGNELEQFEELLTCMLQVGFTESEIENILSTVAGIMHLSRVSFSEMSEPGNTYIDGMTRTRVDDYEPLRMACKLLEITNIPSLIPASITDPVEAMADIFRFKSIRNVEGGGSQWIRTPREPTHASQIRDSIIKEIYSRLFDWIIRRINRSLSNHPPGDYGSEALSRSMSHQNRELTSESRARKASIHHLTSHAPPRNATPPIGLLDIYGFEVFEGRNSFEQLCINFANEKLQQHFNQHVLALEQAVYKKEDIDWSDIEFTDNRDVIRSLEEPPHGVFVILDDTRVTDKNHDQLFLQEIERRGIRPIVSLPDKKQFKVTTFTVRHYAGDVDYCSTGFVEKNVDKLEAQSCYFLSKASTKTIIRELFPHTECGENIANKRNSLKATLGVEFRNQLESLLNSLTATTPTYVRCIKPNNYKKPSCFQSLDVLRQLEYAGLLESIRIRNSGFGVRASFRDFLDDYAVLLKSDYQVYQRSKHTYSVEKQKEICTRLLLAYDPSAQPATTSLSSPVASRHWQIGRSKIFMKEESQARLEQARMSRRTAAATYIQARLRGHKQRKWIAKLRARCVKIQAAVRGWQARRMYAKVKAVVTIQRYWLYTRPHRLWFLDLKHRVRFIQTWWRFQLWKRRPAMPQFETDASSSAYNVPHSQERSTMETLNDLRHGGDPATYRQMKNRDFFLRGKEPLVKPDFRDSRPISQVPSSSLGKAKKPKSPSSDLKAKRKMRSEATEGRIIKHPPQPAGYNYETTVHLMFSELSAQLRKSEKEQKRLRSENGKLREQLLIKQEELKKWENEKTALELDMHERNQIMTTELEALSESNDTLRIKTRQMYNVVQRIESVLSDIMNYASERQKPGFYPDCDLVRDLASVVTGCCSRGYDILRSAAYQMSQDQELLLYDGTEQSSTSPLMKTAGGLTTPPYGSELGGPRLLGGRLSRMGEAEELLQLKRHHMHRFQPSLRNDSSYHDEFEERSGRMSSNVQRTLRNTPSAAYRTQRDARNPYLTLGGKALAPADAPQPWDYARFR